MHYGVMTSRLADEVVRSITVGSDGERSVNKTRVRMDGIQQQVEVAKVIARRVRDGRARQRLSRKRLAQLAGVSERYLSQLESQEANASIAILIRVAQALDMDFRELLSADDATVDGGPVVGGRFTMQRDANPDAPQDGQFDRIAMAPLLALATDLSSHELNYLLPKISAELETFRKSRRGIALLGLRGAGKSSIGRAYAQRHGLPFVSVTREVEARAGMNLSELFSLGGPDAYRLLENEVVDTFASKTDKFVLETSGGIVGNPEALDRILSSFKTVWLKAQPQEHLARVAGQGDVRPMQGNPRALDQLKVLLRQREADYAKAEHALDTTGRTIDECVTALEALVGNGH